MSKGMAACLTVLLVGATAAGEIPASGPAPMSPAPLTVEDDTPTGGSETPLAAPADVTSANRFWISGEYLLWWIKDSHYPPLLTSGSPTDPLPGALGMPGTQVLFGGNVDNQARSGANLGGGLWLDENGRLGVEAGYLFLGTRSAGVTSGAPGVPGTGVTARPFFNVLTGTEDSSLEAYPGLAAGSAIVSSSSAMQAGEGNAVLGLCDGPHFRLEALAGFRYVHLDEHLRIQENVQVSPTASNFGGDSLGVLDKFDTANDFYGAQIGARAGFQFARWEAMLLAKVALGDVQESVAIGGATAITSPGGSTAVTPGGLLALPTNSGTFHRDAFAVVPEIGIRVDYRITRHLHAFIGYSFMYWSEVARPGDQIDFRLNVNQVPTSKTFGDSGGPSHPAFSFSGTDFWAQGVSFGMEFRY